MKAAKTREVRLDIRASWLDHKVPFLTVVDPFLLHLFAALAEREWRAIGERTRL